MEKLSSWRLCRGRALRSQREARDLVCSQGAMEVPTGHFWHVCSSASCPPWGSVPGGYSPKHPPAARAAAFAPSQFIFYTIKIKRAAEQPPEREGCELTAVTAAFQ